MRPTLQDPGSSTARWMRFVVICLMALAAGQAAGYFLFHDAPLHSIVPMAATSVLLGWFFAFRSPKPRG